MTPTTHQRQTYRIEDSFHKRSLKHTSIGRKQFFCTNKKVENEPGFHVRAHKEYAAVHKVRVRVHKEYEAVHKVHVTVHKEYAAVHKVHVRMHKEYVTVHCIHVRVHKEYVTVRKVHVRVHKEYVTVHCVHVRVHKECETKHGVFLEKTGGCHRPSVRFNRRRRLKIKKAFCKRL